MYDPQIGRWHTPDPMVGKYVDWSPYNYVYNNPIKHIDPDGKEIWLYYEEEKRNKKGKIQYKKNGEAKMVTKSVQYMEGKLLDSKGNEYTGDNKFLGQAKGALDYAQKNGAVINTLDGKHTVQELVDSKEKLFVKEGGKYGSGSYYDDKTKTIRFDPNAAKHLKNNQGEIVGAQSAALEFFHEIGHAYMNIFNGVVPPKFDRNNPIQTMNDALMAENQIVRQFENPAATKLGETPRTSCSQKSDYFTPVSTTSTEKQKE